MSTFMEAIVTILLAVVGLAIVATVVSRNANTPAVLQAGASGFGNLLAVAQSPVSGAHLAPVLAYPGSDLTGGFGFGTLA
jgi:hypothetical protein